MVPPPSAYPPCGIEGLAPAAAEIPCNNVPGIPGSTGYQRRQDAERCEGFYQQQVAGTNLEFLSLVNGPINYDLDSDKTITVSVPALVQLQGSQVFLTARAPNTGLGPTTAWTRWSSLLPASSGGR